MSSKSRTTASRCRKELHFVFGYGSLLCPQSRAITAPTLAKKWAQPVLARHVERSWTARGSNNTFVGVELKPDAMCNGVLLQVNEKELAQFDIREGGYDRVSLALDHLERVPFLSDEHHDEDHAVFASTRNEENVNEWMYMSRNPVPADSICPIAQSYVDIILRGCLTISLEFAQAFVATTRGWWHDGDNSSLKHHHTWVNDRRYPQYVRADYHYSNKMANRLDELLRHHQQDAFLRRKPLLGTSADSDTVA